MNKKGNVIKEIMSYKQDAWRFPRVFKALLMDYIPDDKIQRNLIMISLEEKIPYELLNKDIVDKNLFFALKKRLINASGCNEMIATCIISNWIEAFEKSFEGIEKDEELFILTINKKSLFETGMKQEIIKYLNENGIENVGDIIKLSSYEFSNLPNMSLGFAKEIVFNLLEADVPYKMRKHLNQSVVDLINV